MGVVNLSSSTFNSSELFLSSLRQLHKCSGASHIPIRTGRGGGQAVSSAEEQYQENCSTLIPSRTELRTKILLLSVKGVSVCRYPWHPIFKLKQQRVSPISSQWMTFSRYLIVRNSLRPHLFDWQITHGILRNCAAAPARLRFHVQKPRHYVDHIIQVFRHTQ
ncbi:hypothetical protein GYMLUDRAFT_1027917 [Collybiopsis luxurians FD-317 M1]|nr:hypothetical protein GYMLUDRAFT_1027917 [Collybiopsis luxurians FD-317 M1]